MEQADCEARGDGGDLDFSLWDFFVYLYEELWLRSCWLYICQGLKSVKALPGLRSCIDSNSVLWTRIMPLHEFLLCLNLFF